jgi:hypothetical protein
MKNEYEILSENAEGRIQIGRPRRRCEYASKMDLKGIRCEGLQRIHVAHHRIQ